MEYIKIDETPIKVHICTNFIEVPCQFQDRTFMRYEFGVEIVREGSRVEPRILSLNKMQMKAFGDWIRLGCSPRGVFYFSKTGQGLQTRYEVKPARNCPRWDEDKRSRLKRMWDKTVRFCQSLLPQKQVAYNEW